MHKIHVRTGVIDLPYVTARDTKATHDQFILPTGDGETVVELEMFDTGWAPGHPKAPWDKRRAFERPLKRWRFRVVSYEQIDNALDSDIIVSEVEIDEPQTFGVETGHFLGAPEAPEGS